MVSISPAWAQVIVAGMAVLIAGRALWVNLKVLKSQQKSIKSQQQALKVQEDALKVQQDALAKSIRNTVQSIQPHFIVEDVEPVSITQGIISEGSTLTRTIKLKHHTAINTRIQQEIPELDLPEPIAERLDAGEYFQVTFSMELSHFVEGTLVASILFKDTMDTYYAQLVYWDAVKGNLNTKLPIQLPNDDSTFLDFIVARRS